MVIRSIDSVSVGKVLGCLYAMVGVLIGGVFALISLLGVGLGANGNGNANAVGIAAGLGVAALIIFPVMYGAFGFIGGIIMALLYNATASMVGGIEVQTDSRMLDE